MTATDSAGNANTTSLGNFTVDSVAPGISIISPTNSTYGNATILVNISTTGASSIWFYNGTGNTTYTSEVYATFEEGSHTLTAYANDSAGNFNYTSVTFSVNLSYPVIVIYSPTNGASYSNATQLLNISSTGTSTRYNWNGTNYTYTSETYLTFTAGQINLTVYSNSSAGLIALQL